METQVLMQSKNIKQEPDCEMARNYDEAVLDPDVPVKQKQYSEEGHREECSWYSGLKVSLENDQRQLQGNQKIEQSFVDDALMLHDADCSTESDKKFSMCEVNTERCVVGTSCGLQSNFDIEAHPIMHGGGKPFTCDLCGAAFAYCSNLSRHKKTHTGVKPYKCDMCGLGFAMNGHLKSHKRTHTGEKPYNCDVCGSGFSMRGHLNRHKRIHTGEKPYKCDVCGGGFAQSGDLKTHKRRHTGEKPYRCDMCGVGFGESGHLTRHKRIHTGEKPYKCDVCGVGFSVSSHLNRHKKTHI